MTPAEVTDWIDVSVTVRHGMPHWPDNPPIVLQRVLDTGRGDVCNVSHLAMGVHSGTHMDGPVHFIHGAAGLDEMPLTATMGEARVIEIEHPREITAGEIGKHRLQGGNACCSGPRTRSAAGTRTASWRTSWACPSRPPCTWRRRGCRPSGSTTCPSAGITPTGQDPQDLAPGGDLDHRGT